ncbi:hypothetical protein ANCCEY_04293 [Ancylostoma ceylanicum]|uniref:Uncharacterized protein n=1 Tax=Ancylostoma ceylanicum TaxID=53326 RepID=A0A0D6LXL6_9BILA|nr:hypothetical protein ANCCEY_04293 [Ancylostoma ceylanicum]
MEMRGYLGAGVQYWLNLIVGVLSSLVTCIVFLPVFHKMKCTCLHEYFKHSVPKHTVRSDERNPAFAKLTQFCLKPCRRFLHDRKVETKSELFSRMTCQAVQSNKKMEKRNKWMSEQV